MVFDINYLAVIAAAIANMVIGSLWYSPYLFGKIWMSLLGLSEERLAELKNRGMGKIYAVAFLSSLVMAYVLAHFVKVWIVLDAFGAFQLAFWLWLGFIATTMLGSILWEGKPIKLYLINTSHYLVSIFVMTLILAYWV